MEEAFDARVRLIKSSGGVFDVVIDGRKVFSKHESGRFPQPGEIVLLLGRVKP